jgi:secretion/DNA translocation related CpaE-like protein
METDRGGARPTIVTGEQRLLDQILRLCAAAGTTPDVLSDAEATRRAWPRAAAVMVGSDMLGAVARLGLPRRSDVLVVTDSRDSEALWQSAVRLGADDVITLPVAEQDLVERLADLAEGVRRAHTIGVIGSCGGAGATTVATGLALTAARSGRPVTLVDADPSGPGIDMVVGCEDREGLRWPDVAATTGRVSAPAFRAALPSVGSLSILSWDRASARPTQAVGLEAMVRAAQRSAQFVVVDLPRHVDEAALNGLTLCDALVLVVPTTVAAVACAMRVSAELTPMCSELRLLVRTAPGGTLSPQRISELLGVPVAGCVSTRRSVARAVNNGFGPLVGGFGRACRKVFEGLDPADPHLR